jgi:hypothetical protein
MTGHQMRDSEFVLQQRWVVPGNQLAAFDGWYSEEHLADLAGVPGVRRGRRFERVDYAFASFDPARHLVLYDVDQVDAFSTPEYVALSTSPSERTMAVVAGVERTRTLYRQLFPPGGVLTEDGPVAFPGPASGRLLLHVMMSCDPACREEFDGWYNEEHLPAIVSVDGILSGRRLLATDGAPKLPGHPRPLAFLALYEVRSPEVLGGRAFLEAGKATPRRKELGDRVSAHLQLYRLVQVADSPE